MKTAEEITPATGTASRGAPARLSSARGLGRQKREWEDLGALDPMWAILTDSQRQFGRWDVEEFFRTGRDEIEGVLTLAKELSRPAEFGSALDFGCGVGRLSRTLRAHFRRCIGVDISEPMVRRARELNPDCDFVVNTHPKLAMLADAEVDFVYSNIVLQHQPSKRAVFSYIAEFLRVCNPAGIVVFQLPHHLPWRRRLQPRRRAYRLLRGLGLPATVLYRTLKLNPITMLAVREEEVRSAIEALGGEVLKVVADSYGTQMENRLYFVCAKRGRVAGLAQ
jgi:SAM-dependent methyltransferase